MDFGFANLKKMDFRSENLEKTSILVREFRKKIDFGFENLNKKVDFGFEILSHKMDFAFKNLEKKFRPKFRPKFRFSTKIYILDHICHF